MTWKFEIDYTDNTGNHTLTIDEPVGWDGINLHLQRDSNWHGFLDFLDDSLASLQFIGNGRDVLQTLYNQYGAQSVAALKAYVDNEDGAPPVHIYTGAFDFTSYKFHRGDYNYIEVGLETNTDLMKLKNRFSQQVDLDSLASFDQPKVPQSYQVHATFIAPDTIVLDSLQPQFSAGQQVVVTGSDSNNNNGGPLTISAVTFHSATDVPAYPLTGNCYFGDGCGDGGDANPQVIHIDSPQQDIKVGCTFYIQGLGGCTTDDNDGKYQVIAITYNADGYVSLLINRLSGKHAKLQNMGRRGCYKKFNHKDCAIQYNITIDTYASSNTTLTIVDKITAETSKDITLTVQLPADNMTAYAGLNKQVVLKSKVIEYTSLWEATTDRLYDMAYGNGCHGFIPPGTFSSVVPDFNLKQSEIATTIPGNGLAVLGSIDSDQPLVTIAAGSLPCAGTATFSYHLQGSPVPHNNCGAQYNIERLFLLVAVDTVFDVNKWGSQTNGPNKWIIPLTPDNSEASFDLTGSFPINHLGDSYNLWIAVVTELDAHTCCYPDLLFRAGSYFKLQYESVCTDTDTGVYMINETMSRCVESYTNGNLAVYSNYFGRTDAQPYPTPTGCGGMECITNGLKIRNAHVSSDKAKILMTTSMDDCFKAMDAIHNIGLGLEPDPLNTGKKVVRVEPVEYFFSDYILLNCTGISGYSREVDSKQLYSGFKVGYDKFETWSNNGLYDLFGSRTYRTGLNQLDNVLDKTCKFIASDYAIEFTRRTYGNTSSDGRYDNDAFVICLQSVYNGTIIYYLVNRLVLNTAVPGFQVGDAIVITGQDNDVNATVQTVEIRTIAPVISLDLTQTPVGFFANTKGYLTIKTTGDVSALQVGNVFTLTASGGNVTTQNNGNGYVVESMDMTGTVTTLVARAASTDFQGHTGSYAQGNVVINITFYLPQTIITISGVTVPFLPMQFQGSVTNLTHPLYVCEQGNIDKSTKITNATSVLNYRLTPARNAMRHFKNVIQSYRDYQHGKLFFTAGTANFYAMGLMDNSCRIENKILGESMDLDYTLFQIPVQGEPMWAPELVKYDYPLSWTEFLKIFQNPYGLVGYQTGDDEISYGWIEELQYKPAEGTASFTLRPTLRAVEEINLSQQLQQATQVLSVSTATDTPDNLLHLIQ